MKNEIRTEAKAKVERYLNGICIGYDRVDADDITDTIANDIFEEIEIERLDEDDVYTTLSRLP